MSSSNLYHAAKFGDVETTKRLLLIHNPADDYFILRAAVNQGSFETADLLIEDGRCHELDLFSHSSEWVHGQTNHWKDPTQLSISSPLHPGYSNLVERLKQKQ